MDTKHGESATLSAGLNLKDWPQYNPEAIRALDRQLAKLRAPWIISGAQAHAGGGRLPGSGDRPPTPSQR